MGFRKEYYKSVRDGADRKSALYIVMIIHYNDTLQQTVDYQIIPGLWMTL